MVETDTISAIYSHVASMRLSSIIPHAWVHSFGVPHGTRVLPLPRPRRSLHVGLVLAGSDTESLLARALVDTARQLDIHNALDQAVTRRLSSPTSTVDPG